MEKDPKDQDKVTVWRDSNGRVITTGDCASACREGAAALFDIAERSKTKIISADLKRFADILQHIGARFVAAGMEQKGNHEKTS